LSFLADDDDCQTEEDKFTNAGIEEPANFPGTYYGRMHQEGSSRNDASSFSTISLQGTVVAGFFPCEKTTSYIEDTQKRFREEIHRTEIKTPVPRFLSCQFHYKTHTKVTQIAINRCMNEITNHNSVSNVRRSKHREREHTQKL
jgi:hypothetical protein